MAANPQSRKWMLTINNPKNCGLDHSSMQTLLTVLPIYYCSADEIAQPATSILTFLYIQNHQYAFLLSRTVFQQRILKKRSEVQRITGTISERKENG